MRALRVAASLALLAAALPAAADAGTYEVYACGGPAGAAQNAFTASADTMMSAYSLCPPSSGVGTGIVTKATSNGGVARSGAAAYQIFEAPPGAQLTSVTFNVGAIRLSQSEWTAGVVSYDGAFYGGDYPYGCYPWNAFCGVGTSVFSVPVTVPLYNRSRFRFETQCVRATGCDLSASGFTPANRALFSAANVVVRVYDATTPSIVPDHGALWSSGWHRGHEEAWSANTDNVGIMVSRLYVDGAVRQQLDFRDASWPAWARCDFTYRRPCPDFRPGGVSIDTASLADGQHTIRVEVVDAAGNVNAIERVIDVDNSVPAKATGVSVDGGEQWRARNEFTVRWSNPAGQMAPIAKARYVLCRDGEASPCPTGAVEGDGITGLSGLAVPSPGDYTLRVWLEDAAGNQDPDHASDPVHLRFDDEPPSALFDGPDPTHPTRVTVAVADRGSGVAAGAIELRGGGRRYWQEIDSTLTAGRLAGEIDDLALPDGVYELRAHVRDRAGNQHTSDRRRDGSKMEVELPLRSASEILLTAGRRRAHGRAQVLIRNREARIQGIVQSGGVPIVHAVVTASETLRTGGPARRLATVHADALGRFEVPLGAGPSRTVRFQYGGTPLIRPAAGEARLLAPARSSIAVDRRSVRNGRTVTFTGRLDGGPIPQGGKLIDLQAFYRSRWRTFAAPRTDGRGRWRYRYRFGATRGVVRYRFRARIRREAAYPYELGHSRTLRVTVRG